MNPLEKTLTQARQSNYEQENNPFFDNLLMHKILSKEEVAMLFRKSVTWVARMTTCGALPHHYVGDTAMFYLDEVVDAFLSNSLAKRRKPDEYQKKNQQRQNCEIRSQGDGSRENAIQALRQAARSRGLD